MPIDYSSLKKLESLPASTTGQPPNDDARVVVLIKLRPGAVLPEFISARAEIAKGMYSAEVAARDLERIEHDPAVESMSLSRALPMIE